MPAAASLLSCHYCLSLCVRTIQNIIESYTLLSSVGNMKHIVDII